MIYTKKEERENVLKRLKIFDGHLPKRYIDSFSKEKLRIEEHPLFFTLCDDNIFLYVRKAIRSIRNYANSTYFSKAIGKLTNNKLELDHKANVAEIIIVGYYLQKFHNNPKINVIWERKLPNNKNVDISLIGSQNINIEITAIHEDKKVREHFGFRYKLKVKLTKKLESFTPAKYSYQLSICNSRKNDKIWPNQAVDAFIDFVCDIRNKGVGKYLFEFEDEKLGSVIIMDLNKSKKEYVYDIDIWSGSLQEGRRVKDKIIEKAKDQLPENEFNFVCIPKLTLFCDDIDFQEAFLGQEQWHIGKNGAEGTSRAPNGAAFLINEKKYSPVHGLIYTGRDFSQKKIIYNPYQQIDGSIINIIK